MKLEEIVKNGELIDIDNERTTLVTLTWQTTMSQDHHTDSH
jgi:hypothetical protein